MGLTASSSRATPAPSAIEILTPATWRSMEEEEEEWKACQLTLGAAPTLTLPNNWHSSLR